MARPSIVLITADQWRGDLLGCAGHPFAATPNLDGLVREDTRFAQHYGQADPCAAGPRRAGDRVLRPQAPRGRAAGDFGDDENVCQSLAVDTLLTERATPWLAHLAGHGHAVPDPEAGRYGIYARCPFGGEAPQ